MSNKRAWKIFILMIVLNRTMLTSFNCYASADTGSITIVNGTGNSVGGGKRINVTVEYLDPNKGPCADGTINCYKNTHVWRQMEPGLAKTFDYPNWIYSARSPAEAKTFLKKYPRSGSGPVITAIRWNVAGRGVGQIDPRDLNFQYFIIKDAGNNYDKVAT
jgi:hypothetical protein